MEKWKITDYSINVVTFINKFKEKKSYVKLFSLNGSYNFI